MIGLTEELDLQTEIKRTNKVNQFERYKLEDKTKVKNSFDREYLISKDISDYRDLENKKINQKIRRIEKEAKKNSEINKDLMIDELIKEAKTRVETFGQSIQSKYAISLHPNDQACVDKINSIESKYALKIQSVNEKANKEKEKNKLKVQKLKVKIEKLNDRIEILNQEIDRNEKKIISLNEGKLQVLSKDLEIYVDRPNESEKLQEINYEMNRLNAIKILNENEDFQLSVTNLKMYFGGIKAINDLSFYVKKGEIFGLIGPNGAGKTTVFNCITQFYKPTGGNINFKNKEGNIVALTHLRTHDVIKEGIARSFQNVELIWELTVIDNLMVAAHSLLVTKFIDHMLHTKKMKREEFILRQKGIKILENLGILEYAFRSPYGLPYGVLKKIELARTLMTDPSMIILDEPAAGLNDAETKDLAQVIKKINQEMGITIFLVEHDMGLVMSICDTICAISFGKMLAIGTPEEIKNDPEVRKAYLGDDSDE
ncbi:cobalt transporter ATP-binding subunit [Acholeplasma hippikon]|uniref:Cobalt transporter ATP-binding subunit n=1 Tax=Acholeplasma hippikon TaxID=264636 RepID=A0A449BJX1_9MOLU|nr:cobalt transporter ATP-binding subunit [Acholeplasma hippikon]